MKNKYNSIYLSICLTIYMVLQSTGAISLANIQTEFGGANPIGMNEYYANNASGYTSGVTGIPNSGTSISIYQFYGKAKVVTTTDNLTSGNASLTGKMSGGTGFMTNVDDSYALVPNDITFTFYWLGIETGGSIYWNSNGGISFKNSSGASTFTNSYPTWAASSVSGLLLGVNDRWTNVANYFSISTNGSYTIKRFWIQNRNYYNVNDANNYQQYDIRLIRGPNYQYIEVCVISLPSTAGQWDMTNGTTFNNIFNGVAPVAAGGSFVLRSDLTGNNWVLYKNYYVNV